MNTALRIRPIETADARALYAFAMAPEVRRFTLRLPSERFEAFLNRLETAPPSFHTLVAELGGQPVAMGGLMVFSKPAMAHGAQLWIEVDPAFHRRGIGRALVGALLELADLHLGLRRVELHVHATNAAAIALYTSVGFEREGCLCGNILVDGAYVDSLVMGRVVPAR